MYRRILVVVGDHPSSEVAIAHALGLARAVHARLLAVHAPPQVMIAVSDMPPVITLPADDLEREASKAVALRLDEVRAKAAAAGIAAETLVPDSIAAHSAAGSTKGSGSTSHSRSAPRGSA